MKTKRTIKKFVRNLEQHWLNSKNRDLLSVSDIVILEDCLAVLKSALAENDEEAFKLLILEATSKFLLLFPVKKFEDLNS